MSSIKEHVARYRQSLRAVTLLGVLLFCVVIAWLLVRYKSADALEGARILTEIHRRGIGEYLPAAGGRDYYLITSDGRPIGWKFAYTRPLQNGEYSGGCIMMQRTGPDSMDISGSMWKLAPDASAGKYTSHTFIREALPQEVYITRITLDDREVRLEQSIGGKVITASSQRPANYIPEDLTMPAMFTLARKKRDACFRTIYDAVLPDNPSIPFITLRCRYSGTEDGLLKLAVRSSIDNSSTEDSFFFFDAAGKITKILSPGGGVESLTTREELQKMFPNSMNVIKTFLEK